MHVPLPLQQVEQVRSPVGQDAELPLQYDAFKHKLGSDGRHCVPAVT